MHATPLQSGKLPVEIIKETVRRTEGSDPLDVLLSPYYITMFTCVALQQAVAPISKTRAVISRLYRRQGVAVDFERPDRPFNVDLKRAWCHSQDVAYVPIYKHERLTIPQFTDRLAMERLALSNKGVVKVKEIVSQNSPVAADLVTKPEVAGLLADPELQSLMVDVATATILHQSPRIKPVKLEQQRQAWLKQASSALTKALTTGDIPATKDAVLAWLQARTPRG